MTDERQQERPGNFFAGVFYFVVLTLFLAAGIQIGWNDGVREFVHASGGHAGVVSYWAAYSIIVLLTVAASVRTAMRVMLTSAGDKTQVVVAPIVRVGNE